MKSKPASISRMLLAAFIIFFALTDSARAQGELIINGIVTGDTRGFNGITIRYGIQGENSFKIMAENGKFRASIPYQGGIGYFSISTEYEEEMANRTGRGVAAFTSLPFDHAGEITVTFPIAQGIGGAKITGMTIASDRLEFSNLLSKCFQKATRELNIKYGGAVEMGDPNYEKYWKEHQEKVSGNIKAMVKKYIEAHPDSYESVTVLSEGFATRFLSPEEIRKLYTKLSVNRQKSKEGQNVLAYLKGIENSAIGKTVQDFTLGSPDGAEISLTQFSGKYLLIDFWASWCGPCKASFPDIKELYAKYKGKNFEILSISIDASKESWLKELKIQQLPWPQVLDTKGINKSHFLVEGVPTTYLIDPSGKIVLKELGYNKGNSPIEGKLMEIFEGRGTNE